jgi:hypothetical protein
LFKHIGYLTEFFKCLKFTRNIRVLVMAVLALLIGFGISFALPDNSSLASSLLPEASWNHLPRWRGFNLPSKSSLEHENGPFLEDDFRMISELGFNFVRIPLDYRVWIKNGNWNQVNEDVLKEIDQAVEWGEKYHIHVCLNFHRAPGYCINPPQEAKNLWIDPDAQKICAMYWTLFAKRYKGIPNSQLSFELFNEPMGIDNPTYAKIVGIMTTAVRSEDPDRLILTDGNNVGREPVEELIPLHVAQSGHGYEPFGLTHYRAEWVNGSSEWTVPQWPSPIITGYVYGPIHPELHTPWAVEGYFNKAADLQLHVGTVSDSTDLLILADGKTVFEKKFNPGPGKGEWKVSLFKREWNKYQNVYDKDYEAPISAGTRRIELVVKDGDWLNFSALEIKPLDGSEPLLIKPTNQDWGQKPLTLYLDQKGTPDPSKNQKMTDRSWLKKTDLDPWQKIRSQGVGFMVGEWGVYNKTPHEVALRWMKDCLKIYKEEDCGWALWNFRGEFGPVDSGRKDVQYEDWEGHKLDREMLKLLQSY